MKARVKIEGDTLEILIDGVQDSPNDRGKECRIELALLQFYGSHNSYPVVATENGLMFRYVRGDSNHNTAALARKVLAGFCL